MARNDYFVVAYKLLKYLYDCFMAGEPADIDFLSPEALNINKGYWVNLLESLYDEGYIKGLIIKKMSGRRDIKLLDLRITQKGMEFLEENSLIAKARDFLRDANSIKTIL